MDGSVKEGEQSSRAAGSMSRERRHIHPNRLGTIIPCTCTDPPIMGTGRLRPRAAHGGLGPTIGLFRWVWAYGHLAPCTQSTQTTQTHTMQAAQAPGDGSHIAYAYLPCGPYPRQADALVTGPLL